jgi:threonine/homoserine/homoserine lactone efflux protein
MDLLLLGAGIGVVGGALPSPLHMIALAQVALKRWPLALLVLVGVPLVIDGVLLLVTFSFYRSVPRNIAHDVAYLGGVILLAFGSYSLVQARRRSQEEMARSAALTYASVSVAVLAELTAPGTWVYWLTIAGPILAEGRGKGYWHAAPFFAGGLVGYYGAAILSVWLMAWGAGLCKRLNQRLFLAANVLLVIVGISYLVRAWFDT